LSFSRCIFVSRAASAFLVLLFSLLSTKSQKKSFEKFYTPNEEKHLRSIFAAIFRVNFVVLELVYDLYDLRWMILEIPLLFLFSSFLAP